MCVPLVRSSAYSLVWQSKVVVVVGGWVELHHKDRLVGGGVTTPFVRLRLKT